MPVATSSILAASTYRFHPSRELKADQDVYLETHADGRFFYYFSSEVPHAEVPSESRRIEPQALIFGSALSYRQRSLAKRSTHHCPTGPLSEKTLHQSSRCCSSKHKALTTAHARLHLARSRSRVAINAGLAFGALLATLCRNLLGSTSKTWSFAGRSALWSTRSATSDTATLFASFLMWPNRSVPSRFSRPRLPIESSGVRSPVSQP